MLKKIGNYFLWILSAVTVCGIVRGDVLLRITTPDHKRVQNFYTDTHYLVELVVPDTEKKIEEVFLDGLSTLHLLQNYENSSLYIVNGMKRAEKSFNFLIQFPHEGSFTIGPGKVYTNQGVVVSNSIQVNVIKYENVQKANDFFVRWEVLSDKSFVKERIKISLKFYSSQYDIHNVAFEKIVIPHGIIDKEMVYETTEKIDKTMYRVFIWSAYFYPLRAEKIILPSSRVEYTVPAARSTASQFSFFLGALLEKNRAIAQPYSLLVDELPYDGVVAVGNAQDVSRTFSHHEISNGDSITSTVQFVGPFHKDVIVLPDPLLPPSCRLYKSAIRITDEKDDVSRFSFEYVIQPTEANTILIPEQKLYFFDPHTNLRQEFILPAYELLVKQKNGISENVLQEEDEKQQDDKKKIIPSTAESNKNMMNLTKDSSENLKISFEWYILFLLIPVLIHILYWYIIKIIIIYRERKKFRVFIYAQRPVLEIAFVNHDYVKIRKFWNEVVTKIFVNHRLKNDYNIEKIRVLTKMGFSDKEIKQWIQFEQLLEKNSFSFLSKNDVSPVLIAKLYECIDYLKKYNGI